MGFSPLDVLDQQAVERIRLDNYGRNSTTLTPGQQEEAAIAFERLSPYNVPLNTVVAYGAVT